MMEPSPHTQPAELPPRDEHQLERDRRKNRDAIAQLGVPPYGEREDGLTPLARARAAYDPAADEAQKAAAKNPPPGFIDTRPVVAVAGRVMLLRDNGKLIWLNLRDDTGDLQVAVSKADCDETGFAVAKHLDLGDIVVARGPLVKTRTGEITLWASTLKTGAKCVVPPPEKHAGLADVELRYRRRYVDLWSTPETLRVFYLRSAIVSNIRRELDAIGFVEVETPMLQTLAGGAAARPFATHMNALDIDLYLRIAPELYLKRLLVGGMPRVYEINRNFRNEGLDKQHNPEFTMLELYHAFGDCETVMHVTETLVRSCARLVATQHGGELSAATPTLPFGAVAVNYHAPFERISYRELFERALGFPATDARRAREEALARHLIPADSIDKLDAIFIVNKLFEDVAEKSLDPGRPVFITHYPAALSPLTRPNRDDPSLADRADLFIGHMEIAPHYTELNDPDVQEAKFREQLAGIDAEEQTFRTFDEDFIAALKTGMPPAGGLGLGIDRLVMLLTNQRTIRDVVLFPMMRPIPADA